MKRMILPFQISTRHKREFIGRDFSGFTLIELLVVVSIIGILASFSYISYLDSQKAARDTQRRSDLNQYRIKLEQYASNQTGVYPTNVGTAAPYLTGASTTLCTTISMSPCLTDPSSSPYGYWYYVLASGIDYKMYAKIEASTGGWWEVCSQGKTGLVPASGTPSTSATCDL